MRDIWKQAATSISSASLQPDHVGWQAGCVTTEISSSEKPQHLGLETIILSEVKPHSYQLIPVTMFSMSRIRSKSIQHNIFWGKEKATAYGTSRRICQDMNAVEKKLPLKSIIFNKTWLITMVDLICHQSFNSVQMSTKLFTFLNIYLTEFYFSLV